MATIRVHITMDADTVEQVDSLAWLARLDRSKWIREAIAEKIAAHPDIKSFDQPALPTGDAE